MGWVGVEGEERSWEGGGGRGWGRGGGGGEVGGGCAGLRWEMETIFMKSMCGN